MATPGIGAAFSNLQAPKDDIGQGAQFFANIFAERGKENRLRQEREQVRRDEDIKEWEKENKLNYKDLEQKVTGFEKFDDVGRDFAFKAMDKYNSYHDEALKAKKKGDYTTQRVYENKMMKIKSSMSSVKDMQLAYAKRYEENLKLEKEGKMSGVDEKTWLQQNYAIQAANFALDFDENDTPIVHGISEIDVPGSVLPSGKVKAPFTIPMRDMIDGKWRAYERTELLGDKGLIPSVLNSVGTYQTRREQGMNIIKKQLWTKEMTEKAKTVISPLLASDESMADLMHQLDPSSTKREGFTQEEREYVADKLAEMAKAGYKIKYEEEFNKDKATYQTQQQRLKLDRDKLSADIKDDKEKNKIAWAKVGLDRDEFNFKKTQATKGTGIEVGEGTPYERSLFGPGGGSLTFVPYTLRNKTGKLQEIVIGKKELENGKTEDIKVPSVSMSTNGDMITFVDSKGSEQRITRKSSPQTFSLIESQIREEGVSDSEIDDIVAKYSNKN